ncbi:MAG: hypothetical protein ACI84D_003591, partial [Thalassolituus oleivorans]
QLESRHTASRTALLCVAILLAACSDTGLMSSTLTNHGAEPITWRARISGTHRFLKVDGVQTAAERTTRYIQDFAEIVVRVPPGESRSVGVAR